MRLFFRSIWYYWYTERYGIFILAQLISFMALVLINSQFLNMHWVSIVISLLLESYAVWIIVLYFVFLRDELNQTMLSNALSFIDFSLDAWVVDGLLTPVIIVFVINRIIILLCARYE